MGASAPSTGPQARELEIPPLLTLAVIKCIAVAYVRPQLPTLARTLQVDATRQRPHPHAPFRPLILIP